MDRREETPGEPAITEPGGEDRSAQCRNEHAAVLSYILPCIPSIWKGYQDILIAHVTGILSISTLGFSYS